MDPLQRVAMVRGQLEALEELLGNDPEMGKPLQEMIGWCKVLESVIEGRI